MKMKIALFYMVIKMRNPVRKCFISLRAIKFILPKAIYFWTQNLNDIGPKRFFQSNRLYTSYPIVQKMAILIYEEYNKCRFLIAHNFFKTTTIKKEKETQYHSCT